MKRDSGKGESGQAAVEAALTLPLAVFMILGTLQLFLMLQARVMAQYAAFRATRAGSVNHGDCQRMTHAAIGALLPTFSSYLGAQSGSAGQMLGNAFAARANNQYSGGGTPLRDMNFNGPIVWIFREAPLQGTVQAFPDGQDKNFDQPDNPIMRLEVRMVYWYPMKIPFADWVMARIAMAQWGIRDYTAQNPYMVRQTASWTTESPGPDAMVKAEMEARYDMGQYVFPIETTYTMRMMTPAKAVYFQTQNCPPLP
ncbi:MAG: pilus assembly protein [Myxococcales bacterium]|nr:pilus assembly protein [Myxococcales bacterium]